MKRKLLKSSISIAILSAFMQVTPTFASPVDSPVTQQQINATQGQIDDFETKIQKLDNQISLGLDKSEKINNDIKQQEEKINQSRVEIDKARKEFEAHKKIYSERLRSIQSQGQEPIIAYAELLLSSKNISEFLNRSTAIAEFIQSDKDLMDGLTEKQKELDTAEQQLNNELANLKTKQQQLTNEQKQIEVSKQEIEKELTDSKTTLQQQLAQQKAQEEAEKEALLAQQKAQEEATQPQQQQNSAQQQTSVSETTLPSQSAPVVNIPSSNSGKANQVIAYAEQFLGVPYVWGGTTPRGFDCSGLMQYVFHSVGINLPRVASAQQNAGIRISPSQVQPGDLVFMGSPAYHVGMYIGGGKWLHAPQTGDVVKIASYNPARFTSAARILR